MRLMFGERFQALARSLPHKFCSYHCRRENVFPFMDHLCNKLFGPIMPNVSTVLARQKNDMSMNSVKSCRVSMAELPAPDFSLVTQ